MNTLSALRRRVDALLRKYAKEVAVVRLRRLADEYSTPMDRCRSRPASQPPDTHSFILRVAAAGFRLTTFMSVHKYLEECRNEHTVPEKDKMTQALLPWYGASVPFYRFDAAGY